MFSTKDKSQSSAWSKDGDSVQECTLDSLEMRGGLENAFDPEQFEKEQKENIMKRNVNNPEVRARKAGL
jgi:hypothetical protein